MTTTTPTISYSTGISTDTCEPAARVTKSLLGYGIIAGPLYVVVSLAQALTRDGFDLSRHQWSLLSNGDLGWIQIANFLLTGLMTIAAAVGLRRGLRPGPAARWAPRLIGVFGASMVTAGVFRADPALGFPAGTPDGPAEVISWHGMVHFTAAGIGFSCLAAACFVVARRFAADAQRGWAVFSRAVGSAFLAGFAAVASAGGSEPANVAFTVTVLAVLAWTCAVSAHWYRRATN